MYSFGIAYSFLKTVSTSFVKEPFRRTLVDAGVADISDRRAFDHVPDGEAFDGLVFGYCTLAACASQEFDVAAAVLVAASISSFLSLSDRGVSPPKKQRYLRIDDEGHPTLEPTIQRKVDWFGTAGEDELDKGGMVNENEWD